MQMQPIIDKFLRSGKPSQLKLNADDRILITILASYMGKKSECWPPYSDLLNDTGIGSKTTLNKSITKLESLKIIHVERFHRKNNRYTFDQIFLIPWVQIWTQEVQKCTQLSTDMDSNNIINNIKNKCRKNEPKQTAKFFDDQKQNPIKSEPSPLLKEFTAKDG